MSNDFGMLAPIAPPDPLLPGWYRPVSLVLLIFSISLLVLASVNIFLLLLQLAKKNQDLVKRNFIQAIIFSVIAFIFYTLDYILAKKVLGPYTAYTSTPFGFIIYIFR